MVTDYLLNILAVLVPLGSPILYNDSTMESETFLSFPSSFYVLCAMPPDEIHSWTMPELFISTQQTFPIHYPVFET